MKQRFKIAALGLLKAGGVFAVARRITKRYARILCYHGFSYRDEHHFAPQLFMRPETFRARLQQIERYGFSVVSLGELTRRLKNSESVRNLLVFTVDDGWTGFARFAVPALNQHGWPSTLYLTTYYAIKQRPVLNVLRRYLEWRGVALLPPNLADALHLEELVAAARAANVDLHCQDGLMFGLSTPEELASLCARGLDLQLHTHRHRVPADELLLREEINTNRALVEKISNRSAEHLCYPSGEYRASQFKALENIGVQSATTTKLGLVDSEVNPMELPRLLDGENLSALEFEAELSGFSFLVRRIIGKISASQN